MRIQAEFVEGFGALADLGPAISIFGPACTQPGNAYYELAEEIARLLVSKGYAVITVVGPASWRPATKGHTLAGPLLGSRH